MANTKRDFGLRIATSQSRIAADQITVRRARAKTCVGGALDASFYVFRPGASFFCFLLRKSPKTQKIISRKYINVPKLFVATFVNAFIY